MKSVSFPKSQLTSKRHCQDIKQQCLLVMIEKWRQSLEKGGYYGALLTDFSKTFDSLSHDLLIAKLYGLPQG